MWNLFLEFVPVLSDNCTQKGLSHVNLYLCMSKAQYSSGTLEWVSRLISLVLGGDVSAALMTMSVGAGSPSCEACLL